MAPSSGSDASRKAGDGGGGGAELAGGLAEVLLLTLTLTLTLALALALASTLTLTLSTHPHHSRLTLTTHVSPLNLHPNQVMLQEAVGRLALRCGGGGQGAADAAAEVTLHHTDFGLA